MVEWAPFSTMIACRSAPLLQDVNFIGVDVADAQGSQPGHFTQVRR